jgi:uncharacterized protein (DUF2267 family)
MDELVQQVASRTGISQDQAREAVQMAVDFLKARLPAPIAAQVDAALSSNLAGDVAQQALNSLGGLFDKQG